MNGFLEFLQRNSVRLGGTLPLVHTTASQHFFESTTTERLPAPLCDVFVNETLNYFFVGRPAYKLISDSNEPEYWELPTCFVFEYEAIGSFKRVFPFDSGAHKAGRYPSYIGRFDLDRFDAATVPQGPERMIGAFFGSADRYFHLKPKDKLAFEQEFSLSVGDAEVRAFHKLISEPVARADDRRTVIEVVSDADIDLKVTKPLAVIFPAIYLDDLDVMRRVVDEWGAEPITYPLFPLSVEAYYGMIYERIFLYYKAAGYL